MQLSLSTTRHDGWTIVTVAGEVDMDTGPALRDELGAGLDQRPGRLVVDLSGVTFIDSSGLGVLIGARRRAEGLGTEVVLAAPSERVTQVLRLTGLDRVFAVRATVDAALTAS